MAKKYLSLEGLQEYDALLKEKISEDNEAYVLSVKEYIDEAVADKADVSHAHDDMYYTEHEVDDLILNHKHDSLYDSKGSANSALENAKTYTDNSVAQKSQVQIITWEDDD